MIVVKSTAVDRALLDAGIIAGSHLVSINGKDVCDILDYEFLSSDAELELVFGLPSGDKVTLEISRDDLVGLDLEFEPDKPERCGNNCVFCFVHQLPKGLRRTLYIKDEDYRLSFRYGNYVTLTNLSEDDFERIVEQRLSPLYVSVHTTDETLRRKMLGREDIPDLMPQLGKLAEGGIALHTQVVLCPGWNDGTRLRRTVADLAVMYPAVQSVAVVPVGLTRHRSRLPQMEPVTQRIASAAVADLLDMHREFFEKLGCGFVYPADEFFISAGVEIPPSAFYGDFPQFENGVGMVRQLLDGEDAKGIRLPGRLRVCVATGRLIADTLSDVLGQKWSAYPKVEYDILPVENKLLGSPITVSGLLCGKDIMDALRKEREIGDCIVVPPNCLNDDGLFLDDLTMADISREFGRPVTQADYSAKETLRRIAAEMYS
jgi:putative radical SAM enzyme (TIGR03279 family)